MALFSSLLFCANILLLSLSILRLIGSAIGLGVGFGITGDVTIGGGGVGFLGGTLWGCGFGMGGGSTCFKSRVIFLFWVGGGISTFICSTLLSRRSKISR